MTAVLSDQTIINMVDDCSIVIEPFDPGLVQPASVDARLSRSFRVFNNHRVSTLDLSRPLPDDLTEEVVIPDGGSFVIHPGEFCLASTVEWVEVPNDIVMRIEGKSGLARIGLICHATAGFVDPGFVGNLTLELNNFARVPIRLHPGMLICQLSFTKLDRPARRPYGHAELRSHYYGQEGATPSRHETFTGNAHVHTTMSTGRIARDDRRGSGPEGDRALPPASPPSSACHRGQREGPGSSESMPRPGSLLATPTTGGSTWTSTGPTDLRSRGS